MRKQTTEQLRAKAAWEQVSRLNKSDLKEFLPIANGAASLIQKIGLGQAVAFWLSASGKMNQKMADFLSERLLRENNDDLLAQDEKFKQGKKLMVFIMEQSSIDYRRITNEAVAYLFWVKRFSKARNKDQD